MKNTHIKAAFFWELKQKYFSYMLLQDENCAVLLSPKKINLSNHMKGKRLILTDALKKKIDAELVSFFKLLEKQKARKHTHVLLEYKTVSDLPVAAIKKKAANSGNEVSKYLNTQLRKMIEKHKIESKQVRSKLSGESLNKFKRALENLKLIKNKKDAHNWHTMAVALHATKKNCDEVIRKLWKAHNHCSQHKMAGKLRHAFNAWYARM
jgi:hypothetical protein